MRFSHRADWQSETNRISRAIEKRREARRPLIDLTLSNPTLAGFEQPEAFSEALERGARVPYHPDPRGAVAARSALAGWLEQHGAEKVDPDEIFLTSSTSEAYSWILKLTCDPGDRVVRFAPTYPLLDHLCALEAVILESVMLERTDTGWQLPANPAYRDVIEPSRAVIVVHPNNPTGHFLGPEEVRTLSSYAERLGAAIIADEVFFEYGGEDRRRIASDSDCLTFSLGGLSKSAGLPHWKLGWIRVTGPAEQRRRSIESLELIADTYLPVSTPVQHALPEILEHAGEMQVQILSRIRSNLEIIDRAIEQRPSIRREPLQAGWSAVLRVPTLDREEQIVLDLIDAGALVHPGFFYDFPREGWLIVSLLVEPEEMEAGLEIIGRYFEQHGP